MYLHMTVLPSASMKDAAKMICIYKRYSFQIAGRGSGWAWIRVSGFWAAPSNGDPVLQGPL